MIAPLQSATLHGTGTIPEPTYGLTMRALPRGAALLELDLCVDPNSAAEVEPRASLTAAQRQVALLAIEGFTDREIALRLGRSRHTVANLLRQAYRRWNVFSRVELATRLKR